MSLEFYIITALIAAAAVAIAALPSRRGQAKLHLIPGELVPDDNPATPPAINIHVDDNRRVHIIRTGLPPVDAASLAVNIIGFDISIEERLTLPSHDNSSNDSRRGFATHDPNNDSRRGFATHDPAQPVYAHFILDFLAPERYHLKYNSEDTGTFAALTLSVREGLKTHKPLT